MFKSIHNTLRRRQQSIGQQEHIVDVTERAVQEYLRNNYSDSSARFTVRYKEADNTLLIVTPSKTLAGELMLHAPELKVFLAAHSIRVRGIIVR